MISTTDKHSIFNFDTSMEDVSKIIDNCENDEDFIFLFNLNSDGLDLISKASCDGHYDLISLLLKNEKTNKFVNFSNFDDFSVRWAIENQHLKVIDIYLNQSEEFKKITQNKFDYFIYYCLKKKSFNALDLFLEKFYEDEDKKLFGYDEENLSDRRNIYSLIINFNYIDALKKFKKYNYFTNKDYNNLLRDCAIAQNINFTKKLIFEFDIEIGSYILNQIKKIDPEFANNISDYCAIREISKTSKKTVNIKTKI